MVNVNKTRNEENEHFLNKYKNKVCFVWSSMIEKRILENLRAHNVLIIAAPISYIQSVYNRRLTIEEKNLDRLNFEGKIVPTWGHVSLLDFLDRARGRFHRTGLFSRGIR